MPAGVPRANYIAPLAKAIGFRGKQRLRNLLKENGIFPYQGQERRTLEFLIQQGYRDQLKKYRPVAEDAQSYLAQALSSAPPPPKPTPDQNQELALAPSPSSSDKPTRWDQKLTPRLARMLARSYPKTEFEALKRMARKIMRDGGMEPRSEDEAQALAVFQAAGYSIEGFEYRNTSLAVADDLLTVETTQLPVDLEKMPPEQLRLEIVKLRQQLKTTRHHLTAQITGAKHLLENAEAQWWAERVELIAANPNHRPPRTSKADHLWQLALDELERYHLEET